MSEQNQGQKGPKLHELLAVEQDLKNLFDKILDEGTNTFNKKPQHFMAFEKTYEPFDESDKTDYPTERQNMVTTVDDKLKYTHKAIIRFLDGVLQKEATNQTAKGDIIVDGIPIAEGLPATFLLGLESKLKNIRAMYEQIPTLQPGISWVEDKAAGDNVFKMEHPKETFKTKLFFEHQVLMPVSHPEGQGGQSIPAQIEKWEEQKNIGKYTQHIKSSMLTPARKSQLLENIDKLLQAVKKARQRANCAPVVKTKVAKKLLDFIHSI